jgi:hypothetical protein
LVPANDTYPEESTILQLRDRGVLVIVVGEELRTHRLVPALYLSGGSGRSEMPDAILDA